MITLQTLKRYVFLPRFMLHDRKCGSNACEFLHFEIGGSSDTTHQFKSEVASDSAKPIGKALPFVSTCYGCNLA